MADASRIYNDWLDFLKKRRNMHVDVLKSNKNIVIQKGYDYQKVMDDVIDEFGKAFIALSSTIAYVGSLDDGVVNSICEWPEETLALKYPGIGFRD